MENILSYLVFTQDIVQSSHWLDYISTTNSEQNNSKAVSPFAAQKSLMQGMSGTVRPLKAVFSHVMICQL